MMNAELVAMARRNLEHARAGTIDQAAGVYRVPSRNYVDPQRWEREIDRIFRRVPLVAALSVELRAPGAYRAMTLAGVPVLLWRGGDGELRAFVNQCSHRGAILTAEGLHVEVEVARRLSCPYHAWTYDDHGALVGILNAADFGDVDRSCLGLSPLPVAERAGLVFVSLDRTSALDVDTLLGQYSEVLDSFGLADWHLVSRRVIPGPNWKVAYDGYLDFYHLPVLHKNSFGPRMPNRALYEVWGPHQRVNMPNMKLADLEAQPEETWDDPRLLDGVWTIFPHVSIATFDVGGRGVLISQLFPGDRVGESQTVQSYLLAEEPDDAQRDYAIEQADFLERVVREEDYATGLRLQRAAANGAKTEFLFGRNEGGNQRFHQWVDRLLNVPDEALAEEFSPARTRYFDGATGTP